MKRILLTSITLVTLLGAGSALAQVVIYSNGVNNKSSFKEIKLAGGKKKCSKNWRGKKKLGFKAERGNSHCSLRLPVSGDSNRPNHTVQALAKIANGTDKKVRDATYVGAAVRSGGKDGYEMRVFSKRRRWTFLRNGEVIEEGRSRAIGAIGKKNLLRLATEGDSVVARVNNDVLVSFKDPQAGSVGGRKALLTAGIEKRSRKSAVGFFDKVKLILPDP